ncbi:MAG: hypothetical protein P8Y81_02935, partial [Ignavibacteriaceae bacterium]
MKRLLYTFLFTSLVFSFSVINVHGQGKTNLVNSVFKNSRVLINPTTKAPSNIRFSNDSQITLKSFFNEYKKTFGLSDDNEIRSYKVTTDKLGQTHHRYRQYYRGVELAEVQFIIHEKNGSVFQTNGNLVKDLNVN